MVAVIGKTRDLINVWLEQETFKLLALDASMVKPLGRKAIGQKVREENKEIKNGKRYAKYWGQAEITDFNFDVIGAAEAERLVKNRIKWKGKTRRVSVLRKGKRMEEKINSMKKTLVQKRKEEFKGKDQQLRKAPFSFVICYNCRGKGHTIKSCTIASRAVSKKIERKAESADKGNKRVKIIDEGEFTKVVNTQSTPSETPGPAPKCYRSPVYLYINS